MLEKDKYYAEHVLRIIQTRIKEENLNSPMDMVQNSVLHIAVEYAPEMVEELLKLQPTFSKAKNALGETVLHRIVLTKHSSQIKIAMIDQLIEARAEIDARNCIGDTSLMVAAAMGQLEVVTQLVRHNANIDAFDVTQCSVLHKTLRGNNLEVAKFLVQAGADVLVEDFDKETPLLLAKRKSQELYELMIFSLVEKGKDESFIVNKVDKDVHLQIPQILKNGMVRKIKSGEDCFKVIKILIEWSEKFPSAEEELLALLAALIKIKSDQIDNIITLIMNDIRKKEKLLNYLFVQAIVEYPLSVLRALLVAGVNLEEAERNAAKIKFVDNLNVDIEKQQAIDTAIKCEAILRKEFQLLDKESFWLSEKLQFWQTSPLVNFKQAYYLDREHFLFAVQDADKRLHGSALIKLRKILDCVLLPEDVFLGRPVATSSIDNNTEEHDEFAVNPIPTMGHPSEPRVAAAEELINYYYNLNQENNSTIEDYLVTEILSELKKGNFLPFQRSTNKNEVLTALDEGMLTPEHQQILLTTMLNSPPVLTRLSLKNCRMTTDEFLKLISNPLTMNKLQVLILKNVSLINELQTWHGFPFFSPKSLYLLELTILQLKNCDITTVRVASNNLKQIHFEGLPLEQVELEGQLQELEQITLISCPKLSFDTVRSWVVRGKKLRSITVENCGQLDFERFVLAKTRLEQWDATIENIALLFDEANGRLDLSNLTIITDKWLKEISERYRLLLKNINLQDCPLVTPKGLGFLLSNCRRLETLRLKKETFSQLQDLFNLPIQVIVSGLTVIVQFQSEKEELVEFFKYILAMSDTMTDLKKNQLPKDFYFESYFENKKIIFGCNDYYSLSNILRIIFALNISIVTWPKLIDDKFKNFPEQILNIHLQEIRELLWEAKSISIDSIDISKFYLPLDEKLKWFFPLVPRILWKSQIFSIIDATNDAEINRLVLNQLRNHINLAPNFLNLKNGCCITKIDNEAILISGSKTKKQFKFMLPVGAGAVVGFAELPDGRPICICRKKVFIWDLVDCVQQIDLPYDVNSSFLVLADDSIIIVGNLKTFVLKSDVIVLERNKLCVAEVQYECTDYEIILYSSNENILKTYITFLESFEKLTINMQQERSCFKYSIVGPCQIAVMKEFLETLQRWIAFEKPSLTVRLIHLEDIREPVLNMRMAL